MTRRLAAAIFALSALLTLGAQPGQDLRTETGREHLRFCLAETDRSVPDCETYALEAEVYAVYVGQESYFGDFR